MGGTPRQQTSPGERTDPITGGTVQRMGGVVSMSYVGKYRTTDVRWARKVWCSVRLLTIGQKARVLVGDRVAYVASRTTELEWDAQLALANAGVVQQISPAVAAQYTAKYEMRTNSPTPATLARRGGETGKLSRAAAGPMRPIVKSASIDGAPGCDGRIMGIS